MNLSDSLQEIINLFQQEITLSSALLAVMKKEQAALSTNNLTEFEAALIEKQTLTNDVVTTEQKLVEILKLNGLSIGKQDMNELITRCNPMEKDKLTKLLDELRNIATQCRDQNMVNSQVISANQNNIESIINILRGQTSSDSNVYDLSGKPAKTNQTQSFGST